MDFSSEKLAIVEWVIRQDKAGHLHKVLALIEQMEHETVDAKRVMGYRRGGSVVTGEELAATLRNGLEEILDGRIIPLDEVERESEQW